ncbi:MAG: dihydrofolate reductase [Betaproteobacteria bacterium]
MSTPASVNRPACLSLIAAVTRDGGIGLQGQLLVNLPEDLRYFRRVTMGCPVVMGRKTWDSLPASVRPLPGRRNVVITRDPNAHCPGAERHTSLEAALQALAQEPHVFVIGGAQIYALALPWADELLLTEIDAVLPADAHFPAWRAEEFELVDKTPSCAPGVDAPAPYAFATYRRRP